MQTVAPINHIAIMVRVFNVLKIAIVQQICPIAIRIMNNVLPALKILTVAEKHRYVIHVKEHALLVYPIPIAREKKFLCVIQLEEFAIVQKG